MQWVISLLFWGQLALAAALYGAVATAPKLATWLALRNEHLQTQTQLVWLEQQVEELRQVTEALEKDPRILHELARIDLHATRPDEEHLTLNPELILQSRLTEQRLHRPAVSRRWYEPVVQVFATHQPLRRAALGTAAALILIAFTFFHPSQAGQFSIGWQAARTGMASLSGRYRKA